MKAVLLAAALTAFGPLSSGWACSGRITTFTALRPLMYNPFAAVDARQNISIKVQNTGSDRCAYQLWIPDHYVPLQFAPNLRFAIIASNGSADGHGTLSLATPILQPSQTFSVHLMLVVFRGQRVLSGVFTKTFGLALAPAGAQRAPAIDEAQVLLNCEVPPIFEINIAGSGLRTSIELNDLGQRSKSVVLQTRSTQTHRLEIQAANGQLVHKGSASTATSVIPYVVAIDGQTYSFANNIVLRIDGPAGEASRRLTLTIGDTSNKPAGIYKDVITIHIASNL